MECHMEDSLNLKLKIYWPISPSTVPVRWEKPADNHLSLTSKSRVWRTAMQHSGTIVSYFIHHQCFFFITLRNKTYIVFHNKASLAPLHRDVSGSVDRKRMQCRSVDNLSRLYTAFLFFHFHPWRYPRATAFHGLQWGEQHQKWIPAILDSFDVFIRSESKPCLGKEEERRRKH